MSERKNISVIETTIKRWKPNHRYLTDKFEDVPLNGFKSTEKSLTDKEAYRVTLSSLRGQLASGAGSPTVGQYSLKAGEEYNNKFDFSYLNRPDLTLVELHEFIEDTRANLESYDENLQIQIKKELLDAEKRVKELEKQEVAKAEKSANSN